MAGNAKRTVTDVTKMTEIKRDLRCQGEVLLRVSSMSQFANAAVEPFMSILAGSEKIVKFITLGSPTAGLGRW